MLVLIIFKKWCTARERHIETSFSNSIILYSTYIEWKGWNNVLNHLDKHLSFLTIQMTQRERTNK